MKRDTNLNEIDQFLERHSLPKPIKQEIDNINEITSFEYIELAINNLPKQKTPGPSGLTDEFY